MRSYFKNIINLYENKRGLFVSATASSLLFSLLLVLPAIRSVLTYTPEIKNFSKHIMSWATASNVDIASRINSYYAFMLVTLLIFLLLFFLICKVFSKAYEEGKLDSFVKYIKGLSYVGIAGTVASFLSASVELPLYIIGGAVFLGWVYLKFVGMKESEDFDISLLVVYILISLPLSLFVWVLSNKYHISSRFESISVLQKLEIQNATLLFVIIWFFISIILLFALESIIKVVSRKSDILVDKFRKIIVACGIPVLLTGILQCIMLELNNVINKRFDILITKPYLMYLLVIMFCAAIMFFIAFLILKRESIYLNISRIDLINKVYFPTILVGFSLVIAQPYRAAAVGTEFFEMANHGLSVDHLFRYGSIPIIETFDAHMLSNQMFAYFYSLINGYEPWAAFLYNPYIEVAYVLVLFYLIKSLIGNLNAFFFILTFPLLGSLVNVTYLLGGVLVFSIYKYLKQDEKEFAAYEFWVVSGILCVYRLDLGFSATLAGLFTYIGLSIVYKKYSRMLIFLKAGLITLLSAIGIFVLLCLTKGVNPWGRIIELIKLCQSNQNWAYASVGDSNLVAYVLGYYIFPMITIALVIYVLIKLVYSEINMLKMDRQNLIMFLFFSAFFFFNISRGIVRHSLAEGNLIYVLGTFPLAALSFTGLKNNENNRILKFLVVSLLTVILININYNSLKGGASMATRALVSPSYQQQYNEAYDFNNTRVYGDIPTDAAYLKTILDNLINPDETYFDFSSTNYFYSLVGRKNPIYANQSPLLISDDTTQSLALDSIKEKQPPIVLMPISGKQWSYIDNIAVDYKYYMLSEYIYKNYTPLLRLSNFDIYSLKTKKKEYLSKLSILGGSRNNIYSGGFENLNIDNITYHNATAKKEANGSLNVEVQGDDPYIAGALMDFVGKEVGDSIGNTAKPTRIKLHFAANDIGNLQIFYTLKENEDFSEVQSETYNINDIGDGSIEMNLSAQPQRIRLDINKSITLKGIDISQGFDVIDNQPEVWSRSLGDIPKLWAEQDGNKAFYNAPYLSEPISNIENITFGTGGLVKNKPMYLIVQVDSDVNTTASVEMRSKINNKLGDFSFNISQGKHDYAIRLSTDYKWWNGTVDYIDFKSNESVSINKFAFYVDGSGNYYDVKQELRLSDFTDENWINGIGRDINEFLFDNTSYNRSQLQVGRKMTFSDNREVKILSVNISGNYMRVEVYGDVDEFTDSAAFPNLIIMNK
ncbi:hypothetical protein [Paenibacillus sp. FSL R7-0337]|uniref:hypothetical protein n=1 Tax=Paenibacillus sp. FSL R7-0337 TaxID=1926588 RepID=UPI00096C0E24|nr:hypothetical protein [Paenibacillus sp. FSL R7-0337]OMF88087.1 hypothetical protein BK147_27575 [Paenibacillus sp. FSL R7-0337]